MWWGNFTGGQFPYSGGSMPFSPQDLGGGMQSASPGSPFGPFGTGGMFGGLGGGFGGGFGAPQFGGYPGLSPQFPGGGIPPLTIQPDGTIGHGQPGGLPDRPANIGPGGSMLQGPGAYMDPQPVVPPGTTAQMPATPTQAPMQPADNGNTAQTKPFYPGGKGPSPQPGQGLQPRPTVPGERSVTRQPDVQPQTRITVGAPTGGGTRTEQAPPGQQALPPNAPQWMRENAANPNAWAGRMEKWRANNPQPQSGPTLQTKPWWGGALQPRPGVNPAWASALSGKIQGFGPGTSSFRQPPVNKPPTK